MHDDLNDAFQFQYSKILLLIIVKQLIRDSKMAYVPVGRY